MKVRSGGGNGGVGWWERATPALARAGAVGFMVCCAHPSEAEPTDEWTHLGGCAARASSSALAPPSITSAAWMLDDALAGEPIDFVGQSSPVTWGNYVYAIAELSGQAHLICASKGDGTVVWKAPVPAPALDSWSSPVVDAANRTVIVATDDELHAFNTRFGFHRWSVTLDLDVVNASPAITCDLGDTDRLFITDYDGNSIFGGGHLYCINIDPFDSATNPYHPGEIVWQVDLNSATSGNSPAYESGVVYVADASGKVRAYDATASAPPNALWSTTNPTALAFFGGVAIRNGYVFAASYNFSGGQNAGNLLKLDALDGSVEWSTPANRTSSIPVVLSDGRIALSSGLLGFGSIPSVQLFSDNGSSASLLWDSALDSWVDLNANTQMDLGEFLSVGGWTTHAALFEPAGDALLLVGGSEQTGLFSAPETLYTLDLDQSPASPGFVTDFFDGAGASPAFDGQLLFSIGQSGLACFGPAPLVPPSDLDRDLAASPEDLALWHEGFGPLDVNGDQTVTPDDAILIESDLRAGETLDTTGVW